MVSGNCRSIIGMGAAIFLTRNGNAILPMHSSLAQYLLEGLHQFVCMCMAAYGVVLKCKLRDSASLINILVSGTGNGFFSGTRQTSTGTQSFRKQNDATNAHKTPAMMSASSKPSVPYTLYTSRNHRRL